MLVATPTSFVLSLVRFWVLASLSWSCFWSSERILEHQHLCSSDGDDDVNKDDDDNVNINEDNDEDDDDYDGDDNNGDYIGDDGDNDTNDDLK